MNMSNVLMNNSGFGAWVFEIYNPNKIKGPIAGYLIISKDHHIVYEDQNCKKMLISIPSQNVAYVEQAK